ncbi:MAG: prolipoprotein diacylglyceryl transferase [Clostridia bacterium]|nr:prolipoprotein diacylglyceryl transferase [Clostridia bacterium]
MLPDPIFLNVHMYGIMIALGVLGAFGTLYLFGKKLGIDVKLLDFAFYNGVASIGVGFLSAALFQGVYEYIEDPQKGFSLGRGITFIGGLIGGVVLFLLVYFALRKKLDIKLTNILSLIPCCITIAHGLGRIGCFFAGCCYGKETDSFLGVKFPTLAVKVLPTQLFEAIFLLLLYVIMSYLLLKYRFRHNFSLYLICYGIFRFFIEYLRGDDRGELVGIISPSQFWSLLMVVIGIVLYFALREFYKREAMKVDNKEDIEQTVSEE